MLVGRFLDGFIVTSKGSKGSKLRSSLKHRHLRMLLGNMVRQFNYVFVSFIHKQQL